MNIINIPVNSVTPDNEFAIAFHPPMVADIIMRLGVLGIDIETKQALSTIGFQAMYNAGRHVLYVVHAQGKTILIFIDAKMQADEVLSFLDQNRMAALLPADALPQLHEALQFARSTPGDYVLNFSYSR